MKHLVKFNESFQGELSFSEFKQILEGNLLDDFNFEYRFNDLSEGEDPFFSCDVEISLGNSMIDDLLFDYGQITDYISGYDSPEELDVTDINSEMGRMFRELEDSKTTIEFYLQKNKKILEFLNTFKKDVEPLFKLFSNCVQVTIGQDIDYFQNLLTFRICFDMGDF